MFGWKPFLPYLSIGLIAFCATPSPAQTNEKADVTVKVKAGQDQSVDPDQIDRQVSKAIDDAMKQVDAVLSNLRIDDNQDGLGKGRGIDTPKVHTDVPPVHVRVPKTNVRVPAIHIRIPAQHFKKDGKVVDIPEIKVDIPEIRVDVPEIRVDVPAIHVDVPSIHVDPNKK
jgi:hypothetical protein